MSFQFPDIHPAASMPAPSCYAASPEAAVGGAPYTFRAYPSRKLICLTISGFWSAETLSNFAVDLYGVIGALGCAPGEHLLCCDVSNAAIQPQDIVKAFQELIAKGPTHARKLALWTSKPLSRMQSRRLLAVRDNIAVFDKEADARRWLAE